MLRDCAQTIVKTMYRTCKKIGVYTHGFVEFFGLGKNYSFYTTTSHSFPRVFAMRALNNFPLLGCGLYTSSTILLYEYNEENKGI